MPTPKQKSDINAKRVANLLAGSDLGNSNEAESIVAFVALRREAAKYGMRVVDLLELPEVRQAVDDQLEPKRFESHEVEELYAMALELKERLTNAMAGQRSPCFGAQSWVLEVAVIMVALVLMLLAVFR